MIDFTELPKDGLRFEQLVRELLILDGVTPHWTGVGPDDGRDLIVDEIAAGVLGSFVRRWLVQCKHTAHSGRAVGRSDIGDFVRDCRQIGATGYMLASSSTVSSGVVRLLAETAEAERFATLVWDGVTIERRLLRPDAFSTAFQFFPVSMGASPWRLYRVTQGSPVRTALNAVPEWAAHYRDNFFYFSSRLSATGPSLVHMQCIVDRVRNVTGLGDDEQCRVRGISFDDKHCRYAVYADYMVPGHSFDRRIEPALSPKALYSQFGDMLEVIWGDDGDDPAMDYLPVSWDVRLVRYSPHSDHYAPDHRDYYRPDDLREMALGGHRHAWLDDQVTIGDWVPDTEITSVAREEHILAHLLAQRRVRAEGGDADVGSAPSGSPTK